MDNVKIIMPSYFVTFDNLRCFTACLLFAAIRVEIDVTTRPLKSQTASKGTISDVSMDDVDKHGVRRVQSYSGVVQIKTRCRGIHACSYKQLS